MAQQKGPCLYRGSRGNEPGTGLAYCAQVDRLLSLREKAQAGDLTRQDRLNMTNTPIQIGDSQFLGWQRIMPVENMVKFLNGEIEYTIVIDVQAA